MCGPKFCAMKITQDVREYAKARGLEPGKAIATGMAEKSQEFQQAGGRIYQESEPSLTLYGGQAGKPALHTLISLSVLNGDLPIGLPVVLEVHR
jgi:hypothetical protein